MRFYGVIKTWNDERGFGFIEPTQGGQEVFVHIKAFRVRSGRPQQGQHVSFEVELGPQGRKRACNVESVRAVRGRGKPAHETATGWGTATLFAIPAFLLVFAFVSVLWRPPPMAAGIYLGASLAAFIACALDKSAAGRGAWRTPESTLHILSIVGGWPGALLAQQFLRHKSTKAEFRAVFWGTVVVNVIAFLVLCSPDGQSLWAAR